MLYPIDMISAALAASLAGNLRYVSSVHHHTARPHCSIPNCIYLFTFVEFARSIATTDACKNGSPSRLKTKEQADGEQVSVGGCLIPVRWMQLGRLRCGLPRLLCPLSLSLSLLLDSNPLHQPARALLGPPCPPPPSQPQFVSAGAFLQAPGPGSQLPPALLHRTTTPPLRILLPCLALVPTPTPLFDWYCKCRSSRASIASLARWW